MVDLRNRWALVPGLAFAAIAFTSLLWLKVDAAPLIFDQSAHLFSALFFDGLPGTYLSEERQYYPPLVHVMFSVALRVTHYRADASIALVVLPFVCLLLFSTYLIGARLWSPRVGAAAAALLAVYPATYIHGRALLLDLPLAALTAAALYALLRADGLRNPSWSVAFGVICALALLTKQMFAAVIVLPLAYDLARAPRSRATLLHGAFALAPVAFVVLWWYLPRFDWFLGDYRTIQEEYARSRGDPDTLSWHGLTYYFRGTWHQASLPLTVLWLVAFLSFLRTPDRGFVIAWWGGVVLTATLLVLKDSRFLLPALPAIALMTAAGLDRLRNGLLLLAPALAFGALQLYAASFGASWLPEGGVVTNRVERSADVHWFAQHWRLALADTSIADEDGWGGAAAQLAVVDGERIAVVADRIIYVATRNPRLLPGEGARAVVVELTCNDSERFPQFDAIVVQPPLPSAVTEPALAACVAGLREDYRIPLRVPRLLPGVTELIVYRPR